MLCSFVRNESFGPMGQWLAVSPVSSQFLRHNKSAGRTKRAAENPANFGRNFPHGGIFSPFLSVHKNNSMENMFGEMVSTNTREPVLSHQQRTSFYFASTCLPPLWSSSALKLRLRPSDALWLLASAGGFVRARMCQRQRQEYAERVDRGKRDLTFM